MDARSVDLARLIAVVAEEVMAATRRPVTACACHAVAEDCCPTRLQSIIDAGATRLGYHAHGRHGRRGRADRSHVAEA